VLIRRDTLEAIRDGSVTLAFRRWARPRLRARTKMRTAVGLVEVVSLARVNDLTDAEARAAGEADRAAVLARLRRREPEPLYRIELRYAGEDPRVALRENVTPDELTALAQRLDAIDARSPRGPWTWTVLELIERRPARLAADLAAQLGRERRPFKADVRRLKELGLTESLERGYRLSPRGKALLAFNAAARPPAEPPRAPRAAGARRRRPPP
jgi:hypothetical protein